MNFIGKFIKNRGKKKKTHIYIESELKIENLLFFIQTISIWRRCLAKHQFHIFHPSCGMKVIIPRKIIRAFMTLQDLSNISMNLLQVFKFPVFVQTHILISRFFSFQSTLILNKSTNSQLLEILYKGQEERLHAIADDIMEIQRLMEVSIYIFRCGR